MDNGRVFYDSAAQLPDRYQRHKQNLALRRVCQRRYYAAVLDGNLHVRTGESHANADRDRDGNSHSDSNTNGDSNGYAHTDSYAYCDSDSYAYVDAYGPAETKPDTKATSDTAASPIVRSGSEK